MTSHRQTVKELQAAARAAVVAGGPPSKQTPKDKRLKENQPDKAPPVKAKPPAGPKATVPPASTPTLPTHAADTHDDKPVDRWMGRRLFAAARLARWQTQLDTAARRALAARRARTLTALHSTHGTVTASVAPVDPFEADTWAQAVEADIAPVARGILAEVAADTATMVGGDAVGTLPALDVTARTAQMTAWYDKLGADTAGKLQASLSEGANLGETVPELAARVQDIFDASDARATLIARTEISSAANGFAMDQARQIEASGMQLQKSWLAGNCDICTANEDDGPIGTEDTFSSGDDSPPAHAGCVCAIALEPMDEPAADANVSADEPPPDEAA